MPSNGAPRLSIAIAVPARIFGLPRAAPSNSADAPAICSDERLRGGVDLGLAAVGHVRGDVHRIAERLGQVGGATPEPDSCADRVFAGAVPTSACLARDVPAPDLHLLDLLGRGDDGPEAHEVAALAQEQRFGLRRSSVRARPSPASGARNSNLPSLTATSCPISRASPSRNSQSETPPWLTWSNTVDVASTVPSVSPARWATFFATSDAVTCV